MSSVTFVQQPDCASLYYAQCDPSPPAGSPQIVYLLPEGVTGKPSYDLTSSWSAGGYYFFLDIPIAKGQDVTFAGNARSYLGMPGRAGVRLAWIANPNDTVNPLTGPSIAVQPADGGSATAGVTQFTFQNVTLIIGPLSPIAVQGTAFQITPNPNDPNSIHLQAQWGQTSLDVIDPAGITIDCCAPASGCLQFTANLQKGSDLAALDVGLRLFYAMPDGDQASGGQSGDDPFTLMSQRYPVFQEVAGTLTTYAAIDPLAPLDPDRTSFSLSPPNGGAPSHVSNYFTNLGAAVSLTPQPGARLVFATNPVASVSSEGDAYYLVPDGPFSVSALGPLGARLNLMCGVSGVEYLGLTSGAPLRFVAGQSAYAAGFQAGVDAPITSTQLDDLGGLVTTAWAYAPSSGYYAQPDQSVLHTAPTGETTGVLQYAELQLGTLPAAAPAGAPAFPMLPYYNTGQALPDIGTYRELELRVISPARRSCLDTILAEAPEITGDWAVTPQGLLLCSPSPDDWRLILAQDVTGRQLVLDGLLATGAQSLLSALTANQLLLVISKQEAVVNILTGVLGSTTGAPTVALQGTTGGGTNENWTFGLTPSATPNEGWDQYGTILIFKFCKKSLQDLIQDTTTWSFAGTFNEDPAATSATLQSILANNADPSLVTAYTQEDWNGILAVNLPITVLPGDLTGLMAGVDPSKFYCHHLGFNLTPLNISGDGPNPQTTSMFGLVDYSAPPLTNNELDYQFQVQSLQALFQNSTIVRFSSTIQLQINTLFGEPGTGPNHNIVNLTGALQNQGYSYTTDGDAQYTMQSHVLNAVDLAAGQFVTVDPGGNGNPSQSRFLFRGSLDFRQLEGTSGAFDLFSFGSDGPTPGSLGMTNLAIDMSSSAPGQASFAFDAGHMSFDLAVSQARAQSLFSHFPLTLTGFTQADSSLTPAGLGYMSISNPLGQSDMTYPWFALNFDLNLGSFGALAGEVGFVAQLLAAWSPNPTNYSVFVGLQLPGSSGGQQRQISFENVLRLVFQDILFTPQAGNNTGSYMLVLRNIALQFFKVSFPPGGQIDLYIFGNPGASGASLGWYAGYVKNSSGKSLTGDAAPMLPPPVPINGSNG